MSCFCCGENCDGDERYSTEALEKILAVAKEVS